MAVPISKAAWVALTKHSDDDCEIEAVSYAGGESRAVECLTHGEVVCEVIAACRRCGTLLSANGYCNDQTCPYSDHQQDGSWTED